MKPLLTTEQMRALEQVAAQRFGLPESLLMENAGASLACEALQMASAQGRFAVLCGRGNNGGDGLVAARKLAEAGREVWVEIVGGAKGLKGEPARNATALPAFGLAPAPIAKGAPLGTGDVVVDAIFGTGLNRAPEGVYAEAIERIGAWRKQGAKVLAADVPSGLNADTGLPFSPCAEADVTVCFGYLKVGVVIEPGAFLCGEVHASPIGLPSLAKAGLPPARLSLIEAEDIRSRLPRRAKTAHKGSFGHVLVIAGSWGKTGAAALCALGALRVGAGLVTVATRPEALIPILAHAPELMGFELVAENGLCMGDLEALVSASRGKQALVIGPGIPRGDETAQLVSALIKQVQIPCVLDADALNAVAPNLSLLERPAAPVVLTPHPAEMARLLAIATEEVQQARLSCAQRLAKECQAWVVLKGARTLLAQPDGTGWVNPTGNPGMATGGTGDVLAGMCAGLLAQGLSRETAVLSAVYLHGLAGDRASTRVGQAGLLASDLFTGLTDIWRDWGL